MNAEDWRAVIREYGLSGKVSRTQLTLAAVNSEHTDDVTHSDADATIDRAVEADLLHIHRGPEDLPDAPAQTDANRAVSFIVKAGVTA